MGAGLVETGDVDEVIVGAELAVGAAGDGRTGGCCRAGSRCGPVGGRLPRVLQGAGSSSASTYSPASAARYTGSSSAGMS